MPPTVPDTQKAFIQILSNGWVTEFPLSQGQSSTTLGHFKPLSIGTFPLGLKRTKVFTVLKSFLSGFPGGAVAESLPAKAGHTGSNPGLGGSRIPHPASCIPHAAERLGPWATIAEPARLEPVLRNKRGRERLAHRDEEWPPLATTGESPHTETKTQHSQKLNKLKKKKKSFLLTPSPPVVTLPFPFSPRLPNFLQKLSVFAVFNFLSFRFLSTTICLLPHHCTAVALLKVNDHHSGDKTSSDLSCPLCRHIGESPNPDSRIREGWCCCQFLSSWHTPFS